MKFLDELGLADKIIFIIFAICTIVGNTLVLVATWREASLHQPNKYFIASLAVADLLVGMILDPVRVYYTKYDYESQHTLSFYPCRFVAWIDAFALAASICTLTFISFDRYLKIRKPLQYRFRMTTSKSLKIIFIIWFISAAFATYAAIPDSGNNNELPCGTFDLDEMKRYYTLLAISAFFLPTAVMLVMYTLIFVVVHKRQKMMRNGELGQTCNDRNQRSAFLQDLKAIRMLLVVVGVFILCWGPYCIFVLLVCYNPNHLIEPHSDLRRLYIADVVLNKLPYFNSLCNPIVYACMDQTYRAAFKNLFQRMCRSSSRRRQPPEAIELPPLRRR
ncbi:5-hydroxytryptamine receptor 1-like [Paramuricea clavata]|uniref:5-hydroxytryptamine receptor 1-like n=1 Tax=Paramuricea clavata TaxID=317549 RepID=A0A7D9HC72_PARCT|nr:5-hydroxytryptamine receptor 1-like [Paramuricea clavata]